MPEPINSFIFCNNLLRQDSELYYYSKISWSLLAGEHFPIPVTLGTVMGQTLPMK